MKDAEVVAQNKHNKCIILKYLLNLQIASVFHSFLYDITEFHIN